jgi:hypothetical protein
MTVSSQISRVILAYHCSLGLKTGRNGVKLSVHEEFNNAVAGTE